MKNHLCSWPNDSPIESICCFKDGSFCAATHDAAMFVFQTNENKWIPQGSHFQRAHSDSQDPVNLALIRRPFSTLGLNRPNNPTLRLCDSA